MSHRACAIDPICGLCDAKYLCFDGDSVTFPCRALYNPHSKTRLERVWVLLQCWILDTHNTGPATTTLPVELLSLCLEYFSLLHYEIPTYCMGFAPRTAQFSVNCEGDIHGWLTVNKPYEYDLIHPMDVLQLNLNYTGGTRMYAGAMDRIRKNVPLVNGMDTLVLRHGLTKLVLRAWRHTGCRDACEISFYDNGLLAMRIVIELRGRKLRCALLIAAKLLSAWPELTEIDMLRKLGTFTETEQGYDYFGHNAVFYAGQGVLAQYEVYIDCKVEHIPDPRV